MTRDNINLYSKEQIDDKLDDKQDVLTAGENIQIVGTTISADVPEEKTFEAEDYISVTVNGQQIVINDGEDDEQVLVTSIYYKATGQNTDGAMTQKAVTDALPSSDELVPDFTDASQGDVLTVGSSGLIWSSPGAGISISDMGTYYRITY